eukprot:gnl/TRDRNA2_/TRDRNA2_172747_c0_seq1.p1 gnl/TRDRNA2_/TRDRNA2_172747_c0~~gnl/TRDRNA2_/TRDRNA2_172747_c0_seq1.p1  ORF type:complete len:121 (+),score=17.00 gnl/TRDRNA2_/TRDRNA2_172747_c0_seq1:2-364(+)
MYSTENGGEPTLVAVGYVFYKILPKEEILWIEHIIIAGRFRRKGLGKRLLLWAAVRAESEGCRALRLRSLATADGFYSSLGFRMLYDTELPKDLLAMELKLRSPLLRAVWSQGEESLRHW